MRKFDIEKLKAKMEEHSDNPLTLAASMVLIAKNTGEKKFNSSATLVNNWLSGSTEPNARSLGLIATHYGCTESDFFTEHE